jgi:hypothetical protein
VEQRGRGLPGEEDPYQGDDQDDDQTGSSHGAREEPIGLSTGAGRRQ